MPDYPGLGLPLRKLDQRNYGMYPMGIHGNFYGGDSALLPVREVAMMAIMDQLTDKPDWHEKVFNDETIAKWRKEALEYPDESLWKQATGGKVRNRWAGQNDGLHFDDVKPLTGIMSEEAFDYCVQELRNKARYYQNSKLVPTLDACASVVKSDALISSELQAELRSAFAKLRADQGVSPDWHPNSSDLVQDLLHPSMYPLVYGRTRVLKDEVVGVTDAIEKWAGKGDIIKKDTAEPGPNDRYSWGIGGSDIPPNFWSDTYQWLPANAAFQDDGSVKFTSYINGLHPNRYPDIYRTIERLVETALTVWDQCLALSVGYNEKEGAGRTNSRFSKPDNPDDDNSQNWNPSHPPDIETKSQSSHESETAEIDLEQDSDVSDEDEANKIWEETREPIQLQPDNFKDDINFYAPDKSKRLSQKFRNSGLQIIVKLASIELTPEKPEFPVGGWHVEGQMNERICATALYYLDSENVTPSKLSFRMQTSAYMNDEYEVGQDAYHWMEQVYGTGLGAGNSPCLQNYGSVETKEGRMLAFPNVFQHRVSPFSLTDPTKPGHRRFIALWLVDPHIRIVSTANVPPQRLDWWAESILSDIKRDRTEVMSKFPPELAQILLEKGAAIDPNEIGKGRLPEELYKMVRGNFEDEGVLLMSEAEAKEHREKLMQARSVFHNEADDQWHQHSYSFCEH